MWLSVQPPRLRKPEWRIYVWAQRREAQRLIKQSEMSGLPRSSKQVWLLAANN
jgi:hypothetical protein